MAAGSSSVSSVRRGLLVFDHDGVGQRNGLEDGAEFVESVGAFVEDPQVEVDFGERAERRGSRHLVGFEDCAGAQSSSLHGAADAQLGSFLKAQDVRPQT